MANNYNPDLSKKPKKGKCNKKNKNLDCKDNRGGNQPNYVADIQGPIGLGNVKV